MVPVRYDSEHITLDIFHKKEALYSNMIVTANTEEKYKAYVREIGNFYDEIMAVRPQWADSEKFPHIDPFKPVHPTQTPMCVSQGYAALEEYIKSCWKNAIGEKDPATAALKINECLKKGSEVVACQSKACGNYKFKYNPLYPTTKPAKKVEDIKHDPAKITLEEYYKLEESYMEKIMTSETISEYSQWVSYYTTCVKEVNTAHTDYKIEVITILSFEECQTMSKKIEHEVDYTFENFKTVEDVYQKQELIFGKLSTCTTSFEYAEYSAIYQEIIAYIEKEHSTWPVSKPELPCYHEMVEIKKKTKMFEYTESSLTTESSLVLIEKVLREMYSTTELAVYEAYSQELFKFTAIVIKKFPSLE
jgi:hypothetical protein